MIDSIDKLKEFIKKSELYKNNYSILSKNFISSTTKLEVLHKPCGKIIKMSSHDFVVGHSCPICSKEKEIKRKKETQKQKKQKRMSKEEIRSQIINANPEYTFSNLDAIENKESIISFSHICGEHGVSKAKYFLNGHKCSKCSRRKDEKIKDKIMNTHTDIDIIAIGDKHVTLKCRKCNKIFSLDKYCAIKQKNLCDCWREENFSNRVKEKHNGEYSYVSGYKNDKSPVILSTQYVTKHFL